MISNELSISHTLDDTFYATLLKKHPFIPLLCTPDRDGGRVTRCSSPSYDIIEGDHQYQIIIDIPNVKGNLRAEVLYGRILHIGMEMEEKSEISADAGSKVDLRFLLGSTVNTNHITLDHEDDVLTITAQKIEVDEKESDLAIPVPVMEHRQSSPVATHHKDVLMKESYNDRFEEAP